MVGMIGSKSADVHQLIGCVSLIQIVNRARTVEVIIDLNFICIPAGTADYVISI